MQYFLVNCDHKFGFSYNKFQLVLTSFILGSSVYIYVVSIIKNVIHKTKISLHINEKKLASF